MKAEISISQADTTAELIRGLEEIYYYYQYRQDTYVPPNYNTLRLNEMTVIDYNIEDFRTTAEQLVKPNQLREILERKGKFAEQIVTVELTLNGLPEKKQEEKKKVEEQYKNSIDKILTDARLKGSGLSNSLNNEVALLEGEKAEKLLEIESKYLNLENELLAKKSYYQSQIDSAANYYKSAHDADVEKKMNELYSNFEEYKKEVFKYNNSLIEKTIKYNNSLSQAVEKTRLDFMEIKQIELTQEQLIQAGYFNDALEWVMNYYYAFESPVEAYEDFIDHKEFIIYLKYTYDNLLDLLYVRAYGSDGT